MSGVQYILAIFRQIDFGSGPGASGIVTIKICNRCCETLIIDPFFLKKKAYLHVPEVVVQISVIFLLCYKYQNSAAKTRKP